MTIAAGLFLGIFGALGAWFISARYPKARFLRAGYALMSAGGVLFVIWGFSKMLSLGIAATAMMAAGATAGTIGALRKELRPTL